MTKIINGGSIKVFFLTFEEDFLRARTFERLYCFVFLIRILLVKNKTIPSASHGIC